MPLYVVEVSQLTFAEASMLKSFQVPPSEHHIAGRDQHEQEVGVLVQIP